MSILVHGIANEAVALMSDSIAQLLQNKGTREEFHLVVSRRVGNAYEVVYETSFGRDTQACEHKYKPLAHDKTAISARTGLDSRVVQLMHPELLEYSDVIYWGSVIQGDIIVAGSGVQAYFDETIAKMVMAIILGLIQDEFEHLKQNIDEGEYHYNR